MKKELLKLLEVIRNGTKEERLKARKEYREIVELSKILNK